MDLRSPVLLGLAGLPALAAISACQTDEDSGLRIRSLEFDGEATITLSFSDAVADVGTVDPNDFRISAAVTTRAIYTYAGTTYDYASSNYTDLGYILDYGYGGNPTRMTFSSIAPGASAEQVVLTTAAAIDSACEWASETRASFESYASQSDYDITFEIELFLHYAAGEVPITAEDGGHALADVGPSWVLDDALDDYIEEYGFPRLIPRLRIPCP